MSLSVMAELEVGEDVRETVEHRETARVPLAPPERHLGRAIEELARSEVTVFICRDADGAPIAMGTLKLHSDETGEIKRIYTQPEQRGRGLGKAVLQAIIDRALSHGLRRLVLETGAKEEYRPAWRLYEALGFHPCQAVLDYPASEHSRFYEKKLTS